MSFVGYSVLSIQKMRVMSKGYIIVQHCDPEVVQKVVTDLLNAGWELHGDLLVSVVADDLVYVQAMVRHGVVMNYPG